MTENAVQSVLSNYAACAGGVRIEPLASFGGWSGSLLWRVTDGAGGQYCMRRWPAEHPTPNRLRMIHGVLLSVAADLPIVVFPLRTFAGQTFLEQAGHLWELTTWRPGVADFHANPSRSRLRAAMRALAAFHNLASGYERRVGAAPAIIDRVEPLQAMQSQALAVIERAVAIRLENELDRRAMRVLSLLKQDVQWKSLAGRLSAIGNLMLQPAIRDIHHDHVLFTGDEVTGIIDFGAMRIDTPLTDIARLVGSLVGDDREMRQVAFDAYGELRSLSDEDRQIVNLLDESGVILGATNWLKWLYVERRDMGPVATIVIRLDSIVSRLEKKSC